MPHRSVTIDESLLRRMARDAAIYSLTRPVAIVMWLALAAAFVLGVLNLNARTAAGDQVSVIVSLTPVVVLGLALYAIVLSTSSARRAVRAAMPVESVVWVSLEEDRLQLGSDRRRSEIPYRTFQHVRVGRDAVLLKIRDASVATAIPRMLLSDEDIAILRARVA
ncbi:YcxB family protein [Microbacterium sp. p3-SID336]|uniref:YcxB family protein n=1 Tax=Microbacterium sp. p3-SID336 TaxID=2916212 RepID=UPI0021A2E09A|nr:YcxB family protein [Microbacterium sp. p3-SID336]MCT1480043.1 YcxB family protein [Microbacterium sp. p3-SID336]